MSEPKGLVLVDEQLRRSNRGWKAPGLVACSALVCAALLGPSATHAQYGGGYGGGGGDFGGYNPFDVGMMPGFGYDVGADGGPGPGKPGASTALNPVLQM